MTRVIRIGTRGSKLALAQTGIVADTIRATGAEVEIVTVTTPGDLSSAPISQIGVGVFTSALREALLRNEIDVAVHSYKDLPTAPEAGLVLAAVPPREDPRDALIARDGLTLGELP
ncbi:hydroxymethylbilane synthase, partial [Amycolatopsis sp. NPDC000740]